ncbi:MAG: rhodanese-like domain-containing protein, partial [Chloroflexota bacterium]|nr:rhodanese-like domain-containing protein [Chloroflexota bacterium]
MPTNYRDLLSQTKSAIREVDVSEARALIESDNAAMLDVREQDEVEQGIVPGALHIPRGYLE